MRQLFHGRTGKWGRVKTKMNAFYDDPQFDYQKYWQGREYENEVEKSTLKKILLSIRPKDSLLDIGGGFGRLVPIYAPIFKKCVLVDPSEKLLSYSKKLKKNYPNFEVKKGIVENLPFKNDSFQVAICIRVFHHLKNPQKAIKEIKRVLKPKGFLILEFANKIRFKNILKAIFSLDFNFFFNHLPLNISSNKNIPFVSYHPNQIKTLLLANGFEIKKIISVSNFRLPLIKKIVPLKVLLKLEEIFSFLSSFLPFLSFFGPSVFILAQKKPFSDEVPYNNFGQNGELHPLPEAK